MGTVLIVVGLLITIVSGSYVILQRWKGKKLYNIRVEVIIGSMLLLAAGIGVRVAELNGGGSWLR